MRRALPLGPMLLALAALVAAGAALASGLRDRLLAGIEAYNRGDFPTAFASLDAAARAGDAEAMVNLGYMYARGHGVPADPAAAFRLYARAAERGDPEGMNALGYRYEHAPSPDLEQAIRWYCRAVLAGNARAMNNLANLLAGGRGVAQDVAEARELWRQAADRGNVGAQVNLGVSLQSDPALPPDERQAGFGLIVAAARQGSAPAQARLRALGYRERFPPPLDTQLLMRPEPPDPVPDPVPGRSRVCGALVS